MKTGIIVTSSRDNLAADQEIADQMRSIADAEERTMRRRFVLAGVLLFFAGVLVGGLFEGWVALHAEQIVRAELPQYWTNGTQVTYEVRP